MSGSDRSSRREAEIHLCLAYRGRGTGCKTCKIMARGFCDTAVAVLEYGCRKLLREYGSFSDLDKEEILADTFISMERNVPAFKGNSQGQFFSWGHRILQRRIIDHFRRQVRECAFSITEEALARMASEVPNEVIAGLESLLGRIYNTEAEFRPAVEQELGETTARKFWKSINRSSRRTRPHLLPPELPPPERELQQIAREIKELFPELAKDVDFLMDIIKTRTEGRLQKDLAGKYTMKAAALKKRKQRVVRRFERLVERLYGSKMEQ